MISNITSPTSAVTTKNNATRTTPAYYNNAKYAEMISTKGNKPPYNGTKLHQHQISVAFQR